MINEIINISNCCLPQMSGENKLVHDFWCQIKKCAKKSLWKGYSKELYGYDSECAYNSINDFFYLLDLLLYINRDMFMTGQPLSYYYNKFDFDCIKKSFMCKGCNITNALSVFGYENYVATPCTDAGQIPGLANCTFPKGSICSGTTYNFTPVSNIPNTIITWSRAAVTGISNIAATGTGAISETLINTTTSPVVVTYAITLNCNGNVNVQNLYVTVNPVAVMTSPLSALAPLYNGASHYIIRDIVSEGGFNYICTGNTPVPAGAFDPTKWSQCITPSIVISIPIEPCGPFPYTYVPTANVIGTTFTWIASYNQPEICNNNQNFSIQSYYPTSGIGNYYGRFCCKSGDIVTITYTMTTPAGCVSTQVLTLYIICGICD